MGRRSLGFAVIFAGFTLISASSEAAPGHASAPAKPVAAAKDATPIVPMTIVHPSSYDVRVRVAPDASAVIEHTLALRISGGALRAFELKADAQGAVAAAEPIVEGEGGKPVPGATMTIKDDGTIRLEPIDEGEKQKGWKRGAYTIKLALKTDLLKTGALRKDGVFYRVAWTSPMLGEGVDGMRVVFDLPAAPTEPRAVAAGSVAPGGTTDAPSLSTEGQVLRRSASRDELEMVRPHVGRNERVSWEVRVDPRALPTARAILEGPVATTGSGASADRSAPPAPTPPYALAAGAAFFALLLALAKRALCRDGDTDVPALGARWDGPLATAARLVAASFASFMGALALVDGSIVSGTSVVMIAAVILARVSEREAKEPRASGPSEWLALRPSEVFAPTRGPAAFMRLDTTRGVFTASVTLAIVVALTWGAGTIDPRVPESLAVFGVLVPALWLGGAFAPRAERLGALGRAYQRLARLAKKRGLKIVPWGRISAGTSRAHEVRLRAFLKHPIPGLVALELGTAGESFEVLLRVRDESPAERKLAACADTLAARTGAAAIAPRSLRTVPGRKTDERVLALEPLSASRNAAADVLLALGALLVDRRAPPVAEDEPAAIYAGPERRGAAVVAAAAAAA